VAKRGACGFELDNDYDESREPRTCSRVERIRLTDPKPSPYTGKPFQYSGVCLQCAEVIQARRARRGLDPMIETPLL
jgi:hypothetical protein